VCVLTSRRCLRVCRLRSNRRSLERCIYVYGVTLRERDCTFLTDQLECRFSSGADEPSLVMSTSTTARLDLISHFAFVDLLHLATLSLSSQHHSIASRSDYLSSIFYRIPSVLAITTSLTFTATSLQCRPVWMSTNAVLRLGLYTHAAQQSLLQQRAVFESRRHIGSIHSLSPRHPFSSGLASNHIRDRLWLHLLPTSQWPASRRNL